MVLICQSACPDVMRHQLAYQDWEYAQTEISGSSWLALAGQMIFREVPVVRAPSKSGDVGLGRLTSRLIKILLKGVTTKDVATSILFNIL